MKKLSKTLFIIPTDARYYKNVQMLIQFKSYNTFPDIFQFIQVLYHHQGAVLCLAKTTDMVFSVLVDMDSVNAVAAYRPVEHICSFSQAQDCSLMMVPARTETCRGKCYKI
jgi:hypothetical protein